MYQHRTFISQSDDFDQMCALVTSLNGEHLCDWSLGRLYCWMYGRWSRESQVDSLFEKQAELFFNNAGGLDGIVITEDFGNSYYLLSIKNKELLSSMFDFLSKGGNFKKSCVITVPENDECQRIILESKNFLLCNDADQTYIYNLSDIVIRNVELPNGFVITSQNEYLNKDAVELLRYYAFNPGGVYDSIVDYAYKYARKNPILDPELSILMLNEKGEPVATCTGLWDKQNQIMEIETVATKKEYENRGFAKAVISECIKRGIEKNVKKFLISAWNEKTRKVYSSFGESRMIKKVNYRIDVIC